MLSLLRTATSRLAFNTAARSMAGSQASIATRAFSVDVDVEKLLQNNARWRDEVNAEDPTFFPDNIGKGQAPKFLYIGCADSRVSAEQMLGLKPGELFVHRNVANLVVNTDLNLLSCIQFSVEVLRIRHILVCGHYDCGGIKAGSSQTNNLGQIEGWVQNVRDVVHQNADELGAIKDDDERHRRLVELNVLEQCRNVARTNSVQRERLRTRALLEGTQDSSVAYATASVDAKHRGLDPDALTADYSTPKIHPLVFDPKTGEVKVLDMDWEKENDGLAKAYSLYAEA